MVEVIPQPDDAGPFAWSANGPRVTRCFTRRGTGASRAPYAGLNLGSRVEDNPAAVGLGEERVVYLHQVHGADVAVLDSVPDREPVADALVTTTPGLGLAVLAADCVPVLLADEITGVIGAAHVGRPGLVAGTVAAVVAAMRACGATAIDAAVGPAVCGACYEVPQQMHDEVVALVPEADAVSATGTPAVDIARGVLAQLRALGVPATQVLGCTRESDDLYSYRRDGRTGRHAGLIVLRFNSS